MAVTFQDHRIKKNSVSMDIIVIPLEKLKKNYEIITMK